MTDHPEVIVVDGLPETAEVLKAVFEPRGFHVSRQTATNPPSESGTSNRVMVLHDETASLAGPRVIVGRLSSTARRSQTLKQPFHFADLIAAIDAVVSNPAA